MKEIALKCPFDFLLNFFYIAGTINDGFAWIYRRSDVPNKITGGPTHTGGIFVVSPEAYAHTSALKKTIIFNIRYRIKKVFNLTFLF